MIGSHRSLARRQSALGFQLLLGTTSSSTLPLFSPNNSIKRRRFSKTPSYWHSRNNYDDGRLFLRWGFGARFRSTDNSKYKEQMKTWNTTSSDLSDKTTSDNSNSSSRYLEEFEDARYNETISKQRQRSSESFFTPNSSRNTTNTNTRVFRSIRWGVGSVISGIGFVTSSTISLATDRRSWKERYGVPLKALQNFLQHSGVDKELSAALKNRRLGTNLCLLGRTHSAMEERTKRSKKKKLSKSFWVEARRYMRYATAVYGQSMIRAAEVDARGRFSKVKGSVTRDVISHHIDVPPEDIVWMDVNYDGDASHLRHFIAVDHRHKKLVLSLRGTFSLGEIVTDVAGFTREFCGGEAHSQMATMAEQVWRVAGPTVQQSLNENKGYEFIITGHSLGAGAACLLTILLETKQLLPRSQKMRCFAYAAPPVYTPLEHAPVASKRTTNFIHQQDAVPYLSVDSVRHLCNTLVAVDDLDQTSMTRRERYQIILGMKPVPSHLVRTVLEAKDQNPLEPKEGAPVLYIPADTTIWLQQTKKNDSEDGDYYYSTTTSKELVQRGIRVHPDMLLDHFPPRYEHAFDHLVEDD